MQAFPLFPRKVSRLVSRLGPQLVQQRRVWHVLCAALTVLLLARPACAIPASQPRLQSIESAIQAARAADDAVPVVIRGIVILNRPDVVIEDSTGATSVLPVAHGAGQPGLGDEVEVTGIMTFAPHPQVRNATMQRLWGGSMPLPLAITPDQAAEGENELWLVQMDARLVSVESAGLTGVKLNLTGGYQGFAAVLYDNDSGAEISPSLMQPGATLRVTGILFVNHDPGQSNGSAFTIQLRRTDDIELLKGPSWWTRVHILLLVAIGIISSLILVNIYLRLEHRRYRAIAEERANIARDIHDTLAQGFAGITLELEAAEHVIQHDPAQANTLLKEALQLVRHSRDESHLSIEMLRAPSRSDRLEALLARSITHMKAAGATIEQHTSGTPAALSYPQVNNLFRIGQEAIANAVRHSGARKISVSLRYEPRKVSLEVADDGKGFDPAIVPGPGEGHFGLAGLRERAVAMNAKLEIRSAPGGTSIKVVVPL